MRGRQLIDEALAKQGLAVTPRVETDSIASLLAQVGTGRWASIVPQTWIRILRPPAGASVLRLDNGAVTASVAVVTNAGRPVSVLTRALIQAAQTAAIDDLLGCPSPPAGI